MEGGPWLEMGSQTGVVVSKFWWMAVKSKFLQFFFGGVRRYDSQTIKKMRTYLQVNLETSLDQDLARSQSFSPILSGASGHLWTCLPSGFIATCWCYVWKSIAPFVDLEIQLRNCLTIAHPHVLQNLKLNPLQLHICFLEAFLSNLVYIHIYIYIYQKNTLTSMAGIAAFNIFHWQWCRLGVGSMWSVPNKLHTPWKFNMNSSPLKM